MTGPRIDEPAGLSTDQPPPSPSALAPGVAWSRIALHCTPLPAERVPIADATGRVLAEAVVSAVDLPRETNSAMDGFAVRAAEGPYDAVPIVGESRAGVPLGGELPPGSVARIATGATLPAGADAVVKVEDAVVDGDRVSLPAVPFGNNVRVAGEDLAAGGTVVAAGTRLAPHHLVAIAAAGVPSVSVHRRPVVSVVVTGDEIVPPGAPVGPGQVTDVHGIALPALVRAAGATVGEVVHAGDDRATLVAILEGLAPADLVLVTGGLSVGRHDHTRPALAAIGAELVVERLLLRPGQPTAVAVRADPHQLWFGLAGNPVSAFAIAALLVVPAIRALSGLPVGALTSATAPLAAAVRPDPVRWLALRAVRRGPEVQVLQGQGSHMVAALAEASSLVLLPPGPEPLEAGTPVDVLDLDRLAAPATTP
ncbi:MAG: molybdopterin molybdotransferase MoeA [Solirubrobacteraceae bacterium]|nr:molybdopterin molybdotransferase MoeA [Patulibacter sp.]